MCSHLYNNSINNANEDNHTHSRGERRLEAHLRASDERKATGGWGEVAVSVPSLGRALWLNKDLETSREIAQG